MRSVLSQITSIWRSEKSTNQNPVAPSLENEYLDFGDTIASVFNVLDAPALLIDRAGEIVLANRNGEAELNAAALVEATSLYDFASMPDGSALAKAIQAACEEDAPGHVILNPQRHRANMALSLMPMSTIYPCGKTRPQEAGEYCVALLHTITPVQRVSA